MQYPYSPQSIQVMLIDKYIISTTKVAKIPEAGINSSPEANMLKFLYAGPNHRSIDPRALV